MQSQKSVVAHGGNTETYFYRPRTVRVVGGQDWNPAPKRNQDRKKEIQNLLVFFKLRFRQCNLSSGWDPQHIFLHLMNRFYSSFPPGRRSFNKVCSCCSQYRTCKRYGIVKVFSINMHKREQEKRVVRIQICFAFLSRTRQKRQPLFLAKKHSVSSNFVLQTTEYPKGRSLLFFSQKKQ